MNQTLTMWLFIYYFFYYYYLKITLLTSTTNRMCSFPVWSKVNVFSLNFTQLFNPCPRPLWAIFGKDGEEFVHKRSLVELEPWSDPVKQGQQRHTWQQIPGFHVWNRRADITVCVTLNSLLKKLKIDTFILFISFIPKNYPTFFFLKILLYYNFS